MPSISDQTTHLKAIAINIQLPSESMSGLDSQSTDFLGRLLGPGAKLPTQGVTLLYGKGKCHTLRQYLVRRSLEGDLIYRETNPRVEIKRNPGSKLTLEMAADIGFLPISYLLRASAKDDINHRWNRYLAEEGKPPEQFPRRVSDNMYLLDRLILESPYDQMAAISYLINTLVGPIQVITVINPGAIKPDPAYPDRAVPRSAITINVPCLAF